MGKVNKIHRPLSRLKKREKLQINNVRNGRRDVIMSIISIKRIIIGYCKQFT